jgi:hypothetical protein
VYFPSGTFFKPKPVKASLHITSLYFQSNVVSGAYLNMPTARISLTVSSARMPFLERSKKGKNDAEELLPWEKYPGYWDTPHGRLARVRYVISKYNATANHARTEEKQRE